MKKSSGHFVIIPLFFLFFLFFTAVSGSAQEIDIGSIGIGSAQQMLKRVIIFNPDDVSPGFIEIDPQGPILLSRKEVDSGDYYGETEMTGYFALESTGNGPDRIKLLFAEPVVLEGVTKTLTLWLRLENQTIDSCKIIIYDYYGIEYKIPVFYSWGWYGWRSVDVAVPLSVPQSPFFTDGPVPGIEIAGMELTNGGGTEGEVGLGVIEGVVDLYHLNDNDGDSMPYGGW